MRVEEYNQIKSMGGKPFIMAQGDHPEHTRQANSLGDHPNFNSYPAKTFLPVGSPEEMKEIKACNCPPSKDPWIHRSKGMACKTCMWFVAKATLSGLSTKAVLGRCRKHAPTMSGYPAVFEHDWCGDHKIDEEKI